MITIKLEGNAWYAYRTETFINLQESDAGFGDTEIEALQNLLKLEIIGGE